MGLWGTGQTQGLWEGSGNGAAPAWLCLQERKPPPCTPAPPSPHTLHSPAHARHFPGAWLPPHRLPAQVPGSPLIPEQDSVPRAPPAATHGGALQPLTLHSSWPALTASKMKNCTHGWDRKANLPFSAFFYSLGTPSPGQLLVRGHGHYILGVFSSVPRQGWGQLLGRHGTALPHWRHTA